MKKFHNCIINHSGKFKNEKIKKPSLKIFCNKGKSRSTFRCTITSGVKFCPIVSMRVCFKIFRFIFLKKVYLLKCEKLISPYAQFLSFLIFKRINMYIYFNYV